MRVLVSGAAQGIGRSIVAHFAQAGARVAALDIDAEGLAEARTAGAEISEVLDLSDRSAAQRAVERVASAFGGIQALVTAAGGVRGQQGRPIEEIELHDWRVLFEANVDSAFWLAQAVAPHMKREGRGRIITISSGAGLRPSLTGIQAYSASKHALVGLTKQLALELGPFGITVNSVAPGFVLSNPATERQWQSYGQDGQRRLVEAIHMPRLGAPEDIANCVLFLASEEAGWITGQILSVDGGRA